MINLRNLISTYYIKSFFLMILSIFIFVSIITHNPYDTSFNSYGSKYIKNSLGIFGSYTSDFFIQYFGKFSFAICLFLFAWSMKILLKKENINLKFKIFFLFISYIFINFFLYLNYNNFSGLLSYQINLYFSDIFINQIYISSVISLILGSFLYIHSLGSLQIFLYVFYKIFSKGQDNIETNFIQESHEEKTIFSKIKTYKKDTKDYQVKKNLSQNFKTDNQGFKLPPLDLLTLPKSDKLKLDTKEQLQEKSEALLKVLNDFGIKGEIIDINQGPVVTLYEFEPSAGTKSSRVIGLSDDIARSLSAISARIAVIPGRNVLGIELPNNNRQFFRLRELIETESYNSPSMQLPIVLGKDLAGKPTVVDLAKMPHLLVAGTTGSGKSVAINAMIISLLYRHTPDECKFIMIDPKMLELSVYDNIPHLLTPVVTEPGKAVVALKWAVKEMENRYRLMSNLGVRNINNYNTRIESAISNKEELNRTVQTGFDPETGKPIYQSIPIEAKKLPFIVVIVDEMADLMLVAGKDIETSIQRLAQMARAAGIHIIMATQRPSVDVITGVIKANFPSRISFKVTSKIDSRTILGEQGSEQLLGMGDMLYMGNSSRIIRVHGPFVDDNEVEKISEFLKNQGTPEYISSVTESEDDQEEDSIGFSDEDSSSDESLYKKAVQIVIRDKKASTSYVQRSLRIGYNRAAILIERMEKEGIISEPNHSGKREILIGN